MSGTVIPSRIPSETPTVSSEEEKEEKISNLPSEEALSHSHTALEHHKHNVEALGQVSDVEDQRPSLYPVTSYASQIGGEGFIDEDPEETPQENVERDPNLVEWEGPDDPNNPYNWYLPVRIALMEYRSSTYKWWLTFQVSLLTLCVAFTSSVLYHSLLVSY
jgi:hypothetical protein